MLQFILLTATRLSDANYMQAEEVNGIDWVIPGDRYKTKLDQVVPLSTKAQALLSLLPKSGWVFTNNSKAPIGNFSKSKKAFDDRVTETNDGEPLPHWTTHDLRRSARTLMSRAGVNGDIAERPLTTTASLVANVGYPTYRGRIEPDLRVINMSDQPKSEEKLSNTNSYILGGWRYL